MNNKTLIVSATDKEINTLLNFHKFNSTEFDVTITGIGLTNTVWHLTQTLTKKKYSTIIQVGIAGSFNFNMPLTTLVEVTREQLGDLGAENNNQFIPFKQTVLTNKAAFNLPQVSSISVNTCSGNTQTIHNRIKHFQADIENMEGYAFFKVCEAFGIKNYHQIRAISNYVEPRNKLNWKTDEAIERVNDFILSTIV